MADNETVDETVDDGTPRPPMQPGVTLYSTAHRWLNREPPDGWPAEVPVGLSSGTSASADELSGVSGATPAVPAAPAPQSTATPTGATLPGTASTSSTPSTSSIPSTSSTSAPSAGTAGPSK